MKSIRIMGIMTALIFLLPGIELKAQETMTMEEQHPVFGFGIRYMPTVTALDITGSAGNSIEGEFLIGHRIGGVFEANFTKHLGMQTEVIYNSLNQKYVDRGIEAKFRINYVNIPIMFSLNTNRARRFNVNISTEPQFGANVGSKFTLDPASGQDTLNAKIQVKSADFG